VLFTLCGVCGASEAGKAGLTGEALEAWLASEQAAIGDIGRAWLY